MKTPSKLQESLRRHTEHAYQHAALWEAHEKTKQILRNTELQLNEVISSTYFDRIVTPLAQLQWSCFESRLEAFPLLVTEALDEMKWRQTSPSKDPLQTVLYGALCHYFNETGITCLPPLPCYVQPSSGADVSFFRMAIAIHEVQLGDTTEKRKFVSYLRFYRNTWPHKNASHTVKDVPI